MRWADVDLKKAAELHVRQRADRYNVIGAPKSASSTRAVPLPPEVVAALKVWRLACPKGELDLVFPTGTGRSCTTGACLTLWHPCCLPLA
ncbi:MAG TPA: hypothetical protein VKB89_20715 [Xanthobacteraceae bacterium]|nr:hypothetical protein [Xanthobacteraceae bacterium]